jgi:hypothetical protein
MRYDREVSDTTRNRGRRIAQFVYYALAAAVALAATVQITRQVFFSAEPPAATYQSCEDGLRALYDAVERARAAAERVLPDESEEAPLLRFRQEVAGPWGARDAVAELCASQPEHRQLLEALERLRYSEEHGVRHQAEELTALRGRVRKLMDELSAPAPSR